MAYDDIQLHSPGGRPWIQYYQFETGGDFSKGDVVKVMNDGQLDECAALDIPENITGIAMAGPTGKGGITLNNPWTDAAYADGDFIPVLIPQNGDIFITKNFTTDSATFSNAAPTIANIGDTVALELISGVWGVEVGAAAGAQVGVILDILDDKKHSILHRLTAAAGDKTLATTDTFYILFTITSHQHAATAEMIAASA